MTESARMIPSVVCAVALLVLGTIVLAQNKPSVGDQGESAIRIAVPGIPGPYCMYGLEKRLAELPDVDHIELLWDEDAIRVFAKPGASVSRDAVHDAVARAEYPYAYSLEP